MVDQVPETDSIGAAEALAIHITGRFILKHAIAVIAAATTFASAAHAHAGHGEPSAMAPIVHYLTTAEHGPLSLLLLVGLLVVGRAVIRLSRRG